LVTLQKRIPRLSGDSISRFVLRARRAAGLKGTVDVLVTSNAAMRALNRQFRGKDHATDVLSFPGVPTRNGIIKSAGEIAISGEIAIRNAALYGHTPAEEIKVLTLHGILHLAGLDHERDNGQMARKEEKLRRALRLPPTLIERGSSVKSARALNGASRLKGGRRTA